MPFSVVSLISASLGGKRYKAKGKGGSLVLTFPDGGGGQHSRKMFILNTFNFPDT